MQKAGFCISRRTVKCYFRRSNFSPAMAKPRMFRSKEDFSSLTDPSAKSF